MQGFSVENYVQKKYDTALLWFQFREDLRVVGNFRQNYNLAHWQVVLHTTYSWNIKWHKWAGMGRNGLYLKKNEWKWKYQNEKKNPGSRLEVAF